MEDYDETLKRLGLYHLKGNTRAIMKAVNEMMVKNLAQSPHKDCGTTAPSAPKGILSEVVGFDEKGEPLLRMHLTPGQRIILEDLIRIIQAAADEEEKNKWR